MNTCGKQGGWHSPCVVYYMYVYQEEEHSGQTRSSVAIHLKGGKEDDREDDWYQRVEEVPGKGGQPVAGHIYSTHKLQVLGLRKKQVCVQSR